MKKKYLAHKVEAADKIPHPTMKVSDPEAAFCSPPLRFAVQQFRTLLFFPVS